jgi:hypothetical protein
MLEHLQGNVSDRKLRLFACACCRRAWTSLPCGEHGRQAVVIAEKYADQSVTPEQLDLACRTVELNCSLYLGEPIYDPSWWAGQHLIQEAVRRCAWYAAYWAAFGVTGNNNQEPEEVLAREEPPQTFLLRDIIGPLPFRPILFDSAWPPTTLKKLAECIYDSRAFDRLPILADALEEAGCTNADIVGHCRNGLEHVRGCWVIDLLLGKQ